MNKVEFIRQISSNCNIPIVICKKVLESSYYLLCDNLRKGEEVSFYGFGKFYVKRRKERLIKNVGANTFLLLPTKNIPAFKTGKYFKEIIR